MNARSNRINCLDRALDILESVAHFEELGVSELARRLHLHVATTYNLVKTLALRRYLINLDGRYRLGPAAEDLALYTDANLPLPQLLDPIVNELSLVTGENSFAAVLCGTQAKLIVSHRGSHDVTATDFRSVWASPLDLATGRILVAFGPEALWELFVRNWHRTKSPRMAGAPLDFKGWRRELNAIRANHMAEILNPKQSSISAMAAPVFTARNRIVAAIGVSFPSMRLTGKYREFIRRETIRAAGEATQICGGVLTRISHRRKAPARYALLPQRIAAKVSARC